MKILIAALALVLLATPVVAQVGPNAQFAWTQEAEVSVCNSYQFQLELDGVLQPTLLAATCQTANATTSDVRAPIPPITPGTHRSRVRAVDPSIPAPNWGEWSDELTFTMKALPGKPLNFRLAPVPGSGRARHD